MADAYTPAPGVVELATFNVTVFDGSSLKPLSFKDAGLTLDADVSHIVVKALAVKHQTHHDYEFPMGGDTRLWRRWKSEYGGLAHVFKRGKVPVGSAMDFTAYAQVMLNDEGDGIESSFVLVGGNPEGVERSYIKIAVWGIPNPPPKSRFPEIDW